MLWYSVVDKSFGKSRVISLWKRMGTIRLDPKFQAYKEDLKSLLRLNGNCYTCFPPKMGFDCKYQIKFPFNFSPFDCTPNKWCSNDHYNKKGAQIIAPCSRFYLLVPSSHSTGLASEHTARHIYTESSLVLQPCVFIVRFLSSSLGYVLFQTYTSHYQQELCSQTGLNLKCIMNTFHP